MLAFENRGARCKSPWCKSAPTIGLRRGERQQRFMPQDSRLFLSFLHRAQEPGASHRGVSQRRPLACAGASGNSASCHRTHDCSYPFYADLRSRVKEEVVILGSPLLVPT